MPNYDTYNTDPYARFLDWRNGQQNQSLNPLKGRQLGITPDITGQGNWQTGSNILTPQNAGGQGMSQVGEGKYVSNSLAKYYGQDSQQNPTNAGGNNNLPVTQNSEMMGPQRPGFFQNQWNKAKNSYSDSPFNKAIHPDSPWAGRAQPATAGISGTGGTVSPATGGMGGAMGYLGAANAIMGMMNRNQGSSQPAVSQPIVVNNSPPIGSSYNRGERRNRLSSLPNYQTGGRARQGNYIVGNEYDNIEGFLPDLNPQNLQTLGDGRATSVVGNAPDGQIIKVNQSGTVIPNNVLPTIPTEQQKPNFLNRIAGAFKPKEQPIPADYNTPEGANYLNRLMAESQRKPTFTEKLPQALALMSGAFDPYGRFANANANIINMAQQQEQARRQAPVNYLNQVMAMGQAANLPLQQRILQGQVENIPLQQEHLKAQTKALQQPKSITATDMAMLAAGGDPIAIKALGFSKTGENVTPYSVFYQGQKQKYPEKTDYDISQEWSNYQKDIQGQYKPSEYLTFYQGQKQDNPNITDTEIADKWVTYTQNKGLNTYQTVQTAGALRNEIKSNPYVKEFQDVNTKFSVMEKALAESKVTGDRIATDQALITLFNKMTDPESVVRESEYARTPDDASLMNKLKGKIEKLQKGGAGLTDEDRQALYTMANKFYDVYSKNYDETVKNYKELAKASGIKENLIGIPYERKAEIKAKQSSRMVYNPVTGEIE